MRPGKSLRGRTFFIVFTLSFVAMLLATVASTSASFAVYEDEAEQELLKHSETYAREIEGLSQEDMIADLQDTVFADMRCTLVDAQGVVLFDNYADASEMENHADREEIKAALNGDSTVTARKSGTLGTYTLYAATQVQGGMVLRLAETRTSLVSFLSAQAGQLIASLLLIFVISFIASRLLTNMIVRPLRDIDLSRPLENDAYEELQPLLQRVNDQRKRLERQNDELATAEMVRREFTSNVSHEMKTPLQVIGGYAELMEAGVVPPEDVRKFAGLIRSESQSMRTLIDDVLTLSRLDEHARTPEAPISVESVCKRVANRLASHAEDRQVEIAIHSQPDLCIVGDESLAEQMVYNLVDNGIRYNHPGGTVTVDTKRIMGTVLISVSDEGPGVPEEQRERIFERFYRTDASRSRETGGTGLGLAIVKHAAESFGGTVRITDASTGGAKFVISIPVKKES